MSTLLEKLHIYLIWQPLKILRRNRLSHNWRCLENHVLVSFYSFLKLRFSVQIAHQLLLCQCETKKNNKIWILLESKGLRFSKDELLLITSLSFGFILECDKKSLRMRDKYFKGENKVCNDELEKVFLSLGDVKKKNKKKKKKNERL